MEGHIIYFIGFVTGVLCVKMWDYLYSLGSSTMAFKAAITDCLIMMGKNVQSIYEINHLKYLALEAMDKDEKFITFQRELDKRELESMKNTVIRNFVNPIPAKYNHLVPFQDWNGAMEYLDREIKNRRV